MTSKERHQRRFDEKFKRDQVKLIESGELTISDVSRLYDVRWNSVKRWVEKFGEKPYGGVVIQSREEINRIKDLEKKNAHLEKLLGQQQVKMTYLEECVSLAKEQLGADFEKKNQTLLLKRLRERSFEEKDLVMEDFYRLLGIRRQGFHKNLRAMTARQDLAAQIKSDVLCYRTKDARAGSLSLFHNLDIKSKYGIGITKFSKLMTSMGLSLQPLRVRIISTQSCARSRQYTNLLNGLVIKGYGEAVVGDLTYVLRNQLRYYVFSLFDIYSARMVGIWGSDRMRAEDAAPAMEQWLDLRGEQNVAQSIHHTDGGGQYFSDLYLNRLKPLKVRMSVAQDCLQNGYAEQRNGLLKHHLLSYGYSDLKSFRTELKAVERFYNYQRKQEKLAWRTPVAYEQYLDSLSPNQSPSLYLHRFND